MKFDWKDIFTIKKMLAVKVIEVVYSIGLVCLLIATVISLFSAQSLGSGLVSILGYVLIAVLWRLFLEGFIVVFSIHDELVEVRKVLEKK